LKKVKFSSGPSINIYTALSSKSADGQTTSQLISQEKRVRRRASFQSLAKRLQPHPLWERLTDRTPTVKRLVEECKAYSMLSACDYDKSFKF